MDNLQKIRKELGQLPHNKFWQIGPKTAEFLKQKVKSLNAKNVLEIGTSAGYSALWLVEALIKTNGHLYTIESNDERHEFAKRNFEKAQVQNRVTLIKGHAPEIIEQVKDHKFDLIFIDATKKETIRHFKSVYPLLTDQGQIVIDNVLSHYEEFQPFLDFLQDKEINYETIDIENGLLVLDKN